VEQRNDVDALFREVTQALDAAGAKHVHVVDRIRWLASDRDAKEAAREKEARIANEATGVARERGQSLIAIEHALLDAGAPAGLSNIEKVVRLKKERDDAVAEREQLRRMHAGVSADLDRARREHEEALGEAAGRELKLTEERDEVSAALAEAGAPAVTDAAQNTITLVGRVHWLAALRTQAVEAAARAVIDVASLKEQLRASSRAVDRLTAEVKRLESAGSGVRFALTSEPRAAVLRADIVVDAKNGTIVKNRLGPRTATRPARPIPGTKKPSRTKTRARPGKRTTFADAKR
ncbi:MAG TPA: hypothetical protein VIU64_07890, partial [Polyangia bacterium]